MTRITIDTKILWGSKFHLATLIFIGLFIFSSHTFSAITKPASSAERPSVAVVLSGGGSKGAAHIGLLKFLEEQNIAIDYIAGTSIGAIVGGLYAAGYSPDEILDIFLGDEFLHAASGEIDEKYAYYYLQDRPRPEWLRIHIDRENFMDLQGVVLRNIPSSIVSPFLMDFLFMEYLGPPAAAANYSFDNLMIPFRCIVSNIEDNRAEVMRYGSLADAVRASMTFPFYFNPITINGKVKLDGGMYNNFPADVVQLEFPADIIIGSVVSDNPEKPAPDDIFSILYSMFMSFTDYSIPKEAGIVIRPELPELNVTDFSRTQELFDIGYEEATKRSKEILSLFDSLPDRNIMEDRRAAFRSEIPEIRIDQIEISGLRDNESRFVKNFLKRPDEPMTTAQIKERYLALLSMRRFRNAYPRIIYNPESGHYNLYIDMQYDSDYFRTIGGNMSTQNINQAYSELRFYHLDKNTKQLFSQIYFGSFYTSLTAGGRIDILGNRPFFIELDYTYARWNFTSNPTFFLKEQTLPFLRQRESGPKLRIGLPTSRRSKITLDIQAPNLLNRYSIDIVNGNPDVPVRSNYRPLVFAAGFERNKLNRKQFPTKGNLLHLSLGHMGGPVYYFGWDESISYRRHHQSIYGEIQYYWEASSTMSFGINSSLFLSNQRLFNDYITTEVVNRQFNPIPVAKNRFMNQFRSVAYSTIGLVNIIHLSQNSNLRTELHLYQDLKPLEKSINTGAPYFSKYRWNPTAIAQIAFIRHFKPGPLNITLSYLENEQNPWILSVGFGYFLHNRHTFL